MSSEDKETTNAVNMEIWFYLLILVIVVLIVIGFSWIAGVSQGKHKRRW
jgi:hypothetical protein